MSTFRPKLARYNSVCCAQVMPVPVVPRGAKSCCLPQAFCEITPTSYTFEPCNPTPCATNSTLPPSTPILEYNSTTTPPTGTILTYVDGGSIPIRYLECDGSAISRTTYAGLFTAIGTQYGAGDGVNTFNIPNLKDCSCITTVKYIIKT